MEKISDFLGSTPGIYPLAGIEILYIVVFGLTTEFLITI